MTEFPPPPLQAGSVSHTGTSRLDPRDYESIPLNAGFHYVQIALHIFS
jgi:hypothetical protein